MKRRFARATCLAIAGTFILASCGSDDKDSSSSTAGTTAASTAASTGGSTAETTAGTEGAAGEGIIGVILPDSKSSVRWETADRKYLEEAITAAGFTADIQNAEGDTQKMATIADSMIAEGVKVLMIVNLDSDSGATILQKAKDAGIKTIDYDRLTLGGGADVYISFDNVQVGTLQGEGLVKCLDDKGVKNPKVAVLNGSPTDNNATLFKQGYDAVLTPLFDDGTYTLVDDQSVPGWDNQKGGQIFEQMLATAGGSVDGVLAANDGLGGAAIAVLQKNNLQVPVTGQDASVDGLRNILTGDQCMTVYKAVRTEAEAAAAAAIALASGQEPETNGTVTDTQTNTEVPSVLATPVAIYLDNVKDVIDDGYQTAADVCKDLEDECAAAGIDAAGSGSTDSTDGATDGTEGAAGEGIIGVILPDSKSSVRWETADRKYLEEAITAAGFTADIQNAEGDTQKMATIADSMIAEGVKVLMIVNLDSDSGATILQKAKDAGIKTIDYDRLTLGGGADVYISFDNVQVGTLQGEGLVKCLDDKGVKNPKVAVLNGSPTDNNATLFKQGYDAVLTPLFDDGTYTLVDDQSVPGWDNQKGGQIFEQMLATAGGSVDGVLAANDGLGGAAIAVLQKNNLQVPVTGQDASVDGLRNILTGDQCMTVYKAVRTEAEAAAAAAIALASGQEPETNGTVTDTQTNTEVPSVLATPVAIYLDNVKDVIDDGYQTAEDVCKDLEDECAAAGIS